MNDCNGVCPYHKEMVVAQQRNAKATNELTARVGGIGSVLWLHVIVDGLCALGMFMVVA